MHRIYLGVSALGLSISGLTLIVSTLFALNFSEFVIMIPFYCFTGLALLLWGGLTFMDHLSKNHGGI